MKIKYDVSMEVEITREDIERMIDAGINLEDAMDIWLYFRDKFDAGIPCECINDVRIDFVEFENFVEEVMDLLEEED